MKQRFPEPKPAVRRSPMFIPGAGWTHTPAATMATNPPNPQPTTNYPTLIGLDTYEALVVTTASFAAVGNYGTIIASQALSGLPKYTVPAGYYGTVILTCQPFGFVSDVGHCVVDVIGIDFASQAYANGKWTNAWKLAPGVDYTAWRANGQIQWSVSFISGGPYTAPLQVVFQAQLIIYSAS